jgi:hypothetical protein
MIFGEKIKIKVYINQHNSVSDIILYHDFFCVQVNDFRNNTKHEKLNC